MDKTVIKIAPIYGSLFAPKPPKKTLILSGRLSGKTTSLCALCYTRFLKYPDQDIAILLSTTAEINDSIASKLLEFFDSVGEKGLWTKNADGNKFKRAGYTNSIRVFGINDSTEHKGNRTRGATTEHKLSTLIYDELQKNRSVDQIDQSRYTFARQLSENGIMVFSGNRQRGWVEEYEQTVSLDPSYMLLRPTYRDVWGFLSDAGKEEVLSAYRYNRNKYLADFLGDLNAYNDKVVYGTFDSARHYVTRDKLPDNDPIKHVFFGSDLASNKDGCCTCPTAILESGRAVVLERFYYSPKEHNIPLAPSELVKLMVKHYIDIYNRYELKYTPRTWYIDCANAPQIQQLIYEFKYNVDYEYGQNLIIKPFTAKQDKEKNLQILRDCFALNLLVILDEGATEYDYVLKKAIPNRHILKREIMAQRYKENGKLDATISNDCPDALEAGIVNWFLTPQSKDYPERKAMYEELGTNQKERIK